jgi:hypothetical protein
MLKTSINISKFSAFKIILLIFLIIFLFLLTTFIYIKINRKVQVYQEGGKQYTNISIDPKGIIRDRRKGSDPNLVSGFNFIIPSNSEYDSLKFEIFPDKFDLGIFKNDYDYIAKANLSINDNYYLVTPFQLSDPYKIIYNYDGIIEGARVKEAYIFVHQLDWKNDEYKRLFTTVNEDKKNIYAFYNTTAVAIVVILFNPDCNTDRMPDFSTENSSHTGYCVINARNVYDDSSFSFEYPHEWVPNSSGGAAGDAIAFYHPGYTLQFEIKEGVSDLPLDQLDNAMSGFEHGTWSEVPEDEKILAKDLIKIGNWDVLKLRSSKDGIIHLRYFLKFENKYVIFSKNLPASDYDSDIQNIESQFEHIINSFKVKNA